MIELTIYFSCTRQTFNLSNFCKVLQLTVTDNDTVTPILSYKTFKVTRVARPHTKQLRKHRLSSFVGNSSFPKDTQTRESLLPHTHTHKAEREWRDPKPTNRVQLEADTSQNPRSNRRRGSHAERRVTAKSRVKRCEKRIGLCWCNGKVANLCGYQYRLEVGCVGARGIAIIIIN